MRVKIWSLVLATALILAACTDTAVSPDTTVEAPTSTTSQPTTSTSTDPVLGAPLPQDESVTVGVLDNGFTYYLKENDSPGGRIELRLLVDAGSVQEQPDQAGMAHFLEHMMFNGTERFPRNELIAILESFGPRFGPDINAYTSFDETVYELSLAADDELVQLGIDVLREWATRATLTQTDVEEERGVVLDEWRLRTQDFGGRLSFELNDMLLDGSVYEGQVPIGTAESISSATPEVLERFYEDWYRPGRMALVVVGDFDSEDMEERLAAAFGDISPSEDSPEWIPPTYDPPTEPRVGRLLDEEAAQASVTMLFPSQQRAPTSVGDLQRAVAVSLGLQVLGERINDDASGEDSPLLRGSAIDSAWTRAVAIRGLDVQVRPTRANEALSALAVEVERLRTDGITAEEFDRVMASFAAASRQGYEQSASAQDVEFAALISAHHLAGGHLMSPEQRFEVESEIAERLTREEINGLLADLFSAAPVVLATGPDDNESEIPDEAQILAILSEVSDSPFLERESPTDVENLMTPPEPVEPVETAVDPQFGYTTVSYPNGAVVYLWESEIAANGVYALVEGFGGTSVIAVPDLPEAALMVDIASRSGLGALDAAGLRRALTGRIADVGLFLTETRQGIEGSSSTEDLETLFQLIHLTMSAPRLTESGRDAVLDEIRTINESRDDLPSLLFEEALADAYYGDNPRYFVLPTDAQLDDFDLEVARRLMEERFSNPSAFAFAFVGDFDVDDATELASRYIGSMSPGPESSGYTDNQPLPPREIQVETIEAGAGDQGQVGLFFTNEFEPTAEDRVVARLVELIVSSRLRQRVREELSATYSISAGIDLQRDPDPFAEAFVVSSGDPEGLTTIIEEIAADLTDLVESGPTREQFDTAVAQMRDEIGLLDNGTIAVGLITAHLYPDQPFAELSRRRAILEQATPEDVRRLAAIAFDLDQRIEIRQIPRS